jgi:hypothetical protein
MTASARLRWSNASTTINQLPFTRSSCRFKRVFGFDIAISAARAMAYKLDPDSWALSGFLPIQ